MGRPVLRRRRGSPERPAGALPAVGDGAAVAPASAGGATASAAVAQALTCGRFRADICAAYQSAAATGTLTPEIAAVLDRSSPAGVLDRIKAPTLLIQGTQDSLFGLGQADANARGIAANGTPVKVVWYAGGHDARRVRRVDRRPARPDVAGWFDHYLRQHRHRPGHRLPVPGADRRSASAGGDRAGRHARPSSPPATPGWRAPPARGAPSSG